MSRKIHSEWGKLYHSSIIAAIIRISYTLLLPERIAEKTVNSINYIPITVTIILHPISSKTNGEGLVIRIFLLETILVPNFNFSKIMHGSRFSKARRQVSVIIYGSL